MTGQTRIERMRELRRALPVTAAVLLVIALLFPMWRITLQAPQYPEYPGGMVVEVYAYPYITGDWAEVQRLNQYVGFYFPDPVFVDPNYEVHENAIRAPEWVLGPVAFLGIAAMSVFVALAPTVRKLKLGLTCMLVGTVAVFVAMFAVIQYRLHQAGHSLDPDAPLSGVPDFTPPLIGFYEVANIRGLALPGTGAYLTVLAIGLLVIAFLLRNSEATVTDTPALVRAIPGGVRARVGGLRDRIRGIPDRIGGIRASMPTCSGRDSAREEGQDQ